MRIEVSSFPVIHRRGADLEFSKGVLFIVVVS